MHSIWGSKSYSYHPTVLNQLLYTNVFIDCVTITPSINISTATHQNLLYGFLTKTRFLRKYIFDTILYKVSMACTKIRMQRVPKWQK